MPTFWQPRIASSDVLSHTYNAVLAREITTTGLPGLRVVVQWTNVLFDLVLAWAVRFLGATAGERIAVAACVLVFFFGAVAFVRSFRATDDGWTLPAIAVLANGWVLQQGLLNFYLATGLTLGAVALVRRRTRAARVGAVVVALVAWLGNPLPVLWGAGLVLFLAVSARFTLGRRYVLLGAGVLVAAVAVYAPGVGLAALWQRHQLGLITGADQLVTYSAWGIVPASLFIVAVALALSTRIEQEGVKSLLAAPEFLAVLVSAGCVAILPVAAGVAGSDEVLSLVPHRMSLLVGVSLVAAAGAVVPTSVRWLGGLMALTFGVSLLADHVRITRTERAIAALVASVPYRARVVDRSAFANTRVIYDHMVDRYCTGHCWSYANYEPSSGQFRVRAVARNPVVLSSWSDRRRVADGTWIVSPDEDPIYQVEPCARGFCLRRLEVGQPNGGPTRD